MEEHPAAGSPSVRYVVVLIGALGFLVGCFLPYADRAPGEDYLSLYRLITVRETSVAATGSHLYLFAGASAIALIALAALKKPRSWAFPALAAASMVWSLTWIGILLGGYGFYSSLNVGHWFMAVGIAVVVRGTISMGLSVRARHRRGTDPFIEEPR